MPRTKRSKSTKAVKPRPEGRPEKYRKEYDQMVIEHMSQGMSFESFAGVVGTCIKTLYNWADMHPEFLQAKKKAQAKCLQWWEEKAIRHIIHTKDGKQLNTPSWIYNMRCRFGEKWNADIRPQVDEESLKPQLAYDDDELK